MHSTALVLFLSLGLFSWALAMNSDSADQNYIPLHKVLQSIEIITHENMKGTIDRATGGSFTRLNVSNNLSLTRRK